MLYCKELVKKTQTVKEGDKVLIEYVIENQGAIAYRLTAGCGCGCSNPILPKQDIEPGESMIVVINFDTMGKVGLNEKTCTIFYNDKKLSLKFISVVEK